MRMRRSLLTVMIAGIASLGLSSPAKADLITYTMFGTASGQIGGSVFTNTMVVVTMRGNTAGVGTTIEGAAYNLVTTTVNIAGSGPLRLSTHADHLDNHPSPDRRRYARSPVHLVRDVGSRAGRRP